MERSDQRPRGERSKVVTLLGVVGLLAASLVISAAPAAATSGLAVWVGYAASLRAQPTNFPTPWADSPNTVFEGCVPAPACSYDAGAVRVVNNTGSTVIVNAVAVHVDTCTFTGWAPATLAPGAELIVTQMATSASNGCLGPLQMDTSDMGPGGSNYAFNCTPDGILPTVDVTIDGTTTSYVDSGQVLNTLGFDAAGCPLGSNESTQWTLIGHPPCNGSVLSLAPASQTHGVGTTATVTATFTNSCDQPAQNQPLSNVTVNFRVQSGPNVRRTGSATTDINGMASFTYSGTLPGTDVIGASVTNLAGTISSNTVTAIWVLFAPGGGGFVISDLAVNSASVYWWGAQWWKKDHLSSGLAPASFKGFENGNATPWCGQTWTTRPGNSSRPPRTVPSMMAVIVASHITKNGPVISGDIVHNVLVQTKPGYGPNPGHPGTGTIITQLC